MNQNKMELSGRGAEVPRLANRMYWNLSTHTDTSRLGNAAFRVDSERLKSNLGNNAVITNRLEIGAFKVPDAFKMRQLIATNNV